MIWSAARRSLVALLAFGVVTLAACDSGDTEPPPDIEGQWGMTTDTGVLALTLSLSEQSGEVTGQGSLSRGGPSHLVDVSGVYDYPSLSLTLRSQAQEEITFDGTVSERGTRISGILSGGDLGGTQVTLARQ